jgi:RNA ligase
LVTDKEGNIVARSFDKFFNLEEEQVIPNEPFEAYEKLDGYLILVFCYKTTPS